MAVTEPRCTSEAVHPFGGAGAAWSWLARYLNAAVPRAADAAFAPETLPTLVAFVETSAASLLRAFGPRFLKLLEVVERYAATAVQSAGKALLEGETALALSNLSDLLALVRKRGALDDPPGQTTFLARS